MSRRPNYQTPAELRRKREEEAEKKRKEDAKKAAAAKKEKKERELYLKLKAKYEKEGK